MTNPVIIWRRVGVYANAIGVLSLIVPPNLWCRPFDGNIWLNYVQDHILIDIGSGIRFPLIQPTIQQLQVVV
jgi:hypothetical protein